MQELNAFLRFCRRYLRSRTLSFGRRFERVKDFLVAILVVKRGKYSSSFLNTSFFLLVITAMVGGPIIAENNPFINELNQRNSTSQSVLSYNPYENSLGTIISAKPRDKVVEYEVRGGDTVGTIAKKFDVSEDTIRWANDLKNDTIKPGQKLNVPPGTGIVYKVSTGENIYSIAKKYNVDAQKFYGGPIIAGTKGNSNFIWPTNGLITQYPIWYHMALDIANNALPPVLASDTGTVIFAGCISTGYGCHVIINHGNGYQTLYGHLSQILVSPGQAVSQGKQIGFMGSTGRSTGPHLHFEIRSGGTQLNPLGFLKQ
ncbi:peptidoglycan DD-metalloendopeptidase family protein [Candidatus Microgenomates bacterium]|nr:peptidoglycan DD-metalloendopeptidase family protein [Candidatus Microgenomates bacterium]